MLPSSLQSKRGFFLGVLSLISLLNINCNFANAVDASTKSTAAAKTSVSSPGRRSTLNLNTGEAVMLQLDRDATDVIIGNSKVANVSIISPRVVLVTPVAKGITNMVIFDKTSNTVIENAELRVDIAPKTITIWRGMQGTDYECGRRGCR